MQLIKQMHLDQTLTNARTEQLFKYKYYLKNTDVIRQYLNYLIILKLSIVLILTAFQNVHKIFHHNNNNNILQCLLLLCNELFSYWRKSLLAKISNSVRNKFLEIIIDLKRQKREILNGKGTFFTTITAKLYASGAEYFTNPMNQFCQGQLQVRNLLTPRYNCTKTEIWRAFNEDIN